ncbi:hypothetical protein [Fibrobacter sp.]|uniref:hypothetical protein n=1 Tax=Fibrobacter sp. TaxID=35828 RepID=UPI00386DD32B
MAKHNSKAAGKLAETAKESAMLRMLRIDGSQNGAKLRTRIVRDKTKYTRTLKHKKSLAEAGDFPLLNSYFRLNCLVHSSNSLSLSLEP